MQKHAILSWSSLEPLTPTYALAADVDLVVVRWPDEEGSRCSMAAARTAAR